MDDEIVKQGPIAFFHEEAGRHMQESEPGHALVRNYRLRGKESTSRLGATKALMMVTGEQTTLFADIVPDWPDTNKVKVLQTDETQWHWIAATVLNPPDPPWMALTFDKRTDIHDRLHLVLDNRHICFSGAVELGPIDRETVVRAVFHLRDIKSAIWRRFHDLMSQQRNGRSLTGASEKFLEKQENARADLEQACELIGYGETATFQMVSIIHAQLGKDPALRTRLEEAFNDING